MVAKPGDYEELQNRISSREASAASTFSEQSVQSHSALQSLLALSSLVGDPFMQALGRQGSDRRSDVNSQILAGSSFEPIRQGLLTMHTILSTTEALTSPNLQPSGIAEGGSTRIFFVGQWLDVKDTVNQWLEATIMDINSGDQKLFIHYNGWLENIDFLYNFQLIFSCSPGPLDGMNGSTLIQHGWPLFELVQSMQPCNRVHQRQIRQWCMLHSQAPMMLGCLFRSSQNLSPCSNQHLQKPLLYVKRFSHIA